MQYYHIKQREFNGLVADICRKIMRSDWKPDYVVGIGRGGALPAAMISEYFNVPYHSVGVSLHKSANTEHNCWIPCDAFGEESPRKNILVVDDINETGETLNWVVEDWQSSCVPDSPEWEYIWNENIKFAVVVDNTTSKFSRHVDYWGIEIDLPKSDYEINFPHGQWWKS